MGDVMNVLRDFFQRPARVCLAIVISVLAIMVSGVFLTDSPRVEAATVQHNLPTPTCMRRITVNSNPCGATIYIDGIQMGQTPMNFPMPTGHYTLLLAAPGHQVFVQRILVQDAPLDVEAKLVPLR
jgi:hypothetical protein